MDRNTVVRIAIPLSLYESVKGKVLNEAKKPIDPAKKKADAKKAEAKKAAEKKAADIKKKKEAEAKKAEAEKKKAAEAKKKAKA
jgi:colicin import membrane protein